MSKEKQSLEDEKMIAVVGGRLQESKIVCKNHNIGKQAVFMVRVVQPGFDSFDFQQF